jgi:inhibitor of cysteine peptidase
MSARNLIFSLCLILLVLVSGCAGKKTMEVNKTQNGSSIELKKGDLLVITLEGNPTIGYQWEMLPNTDGVVELQGEPAYKSTGSLIGSGGVYQFTLKAIKTGSTSVDLKYYRSFEAGIPPIKTFSIGVEVK